jgi:hypothetical protein
MGYPWNGTATDADFVNPPTIIADGELWQFGDPVTGAGGHFQGMKAALDRIAWLKAHAGFTDIATTWTAKQTFDCAVDFQGAHAIHVKGGMLLNVDSDGLMQVGSGCTPEFFGEVKIDGLLNRTGDSAVTRKRTIIQAGTGGGTVAAVMGARDLIIFQPVTGADKTLSFSAPPGNVPCIEQVLYGGAITHLDSGMPTAWGGPSDHDLTISAGTASDICTHTQKMCLATVVFDGTDFYIHIVST